MDLWDHVGDYDDCHPHGGMDTVEAEPESIGVIAKKFVLSDIARWSKTY